MGWAGLLLGPLPADHDGAQLELHLPGGEPLLAAVCRGPGGYHGYPCRSRHQINYNCVNEPFAAWGWVVGYFMTAIMERQTTKRLVPLDLLDLQGNEGLQMAMASVPPQERGVRDSNRISHLFKSFINLLKYKKMNRSCESLRLF